MIAAAAPTARTALGRAFGSRPLGASLALLALAVPSLVAIAGCSSSSQMMNGARGRGSIGGAMMSSGAGYHLAPTSCTAPSSAATAVQVVLADMGMTTMMSGTAPMGAHMMLRSTPRTVRPGPVTFVATNRGWRTHELVLMPLGPRAVAGHRVPAASGKVSETGALGEASTPCGSDAGSGIPSGSASWVTVTLAAGRYELLCNLPNHYADGMYQELDVSE